MKVLTTTVSRDLDADVTVVDLHGRLTLDTTAMVRSELLKCIAECPTAIIIDMSGCVAETLTALTVFPTVAQHHAQQPSVAVLLCGMDGIQRASVHAALAPVPTFVSRSEARSAVAAVRASQQRLTLRFGPTSAAPSSGCGRAVRSSRRSSGPGRGACAPRLPESPPPRALLP